MTETPSPREVGKRSTFSLSVKALVEDVHGRLLLLRRSNSSANHAGKWELPGGKLDPGETFDAALVREVVEETGLVIELHAPFYTSMSTFDCFNVVYLFMTARAHPGEVHLSNEHDAFVWVAPEDALQLEVAPQFKDVLARYAASAPHH